MNKLSTQPYKGTRDFNPQAMRLQKYMFDVMRKAVEKYGYQEYTASLLEESDLYRAKTGEEIVNEQTYTFTDRGGRDVTLRPEMTPTVARMIADAGRNISFPARWYSIPNCFRYERPQRGRLREFWQLNVDLFGVDSANADAETIQVASDLMLAYGADSQTFIIKINSREIIQALFEVLDLETDEQYKLSKLIDRRDKISIEKFEKESMELVRNRYEIFEQFMRATSIDEIPEMIRESVSVLRLREVVTTLKSVGVTNVVFEPTLIRGFDYYTGIIFEVFDVNPINSRSLFGGGRYNNLTDLFDAPAIPAIGFGVSDVSIENYLETYGLLPRLVNKTKVRLLVAPDDRAALQSSRMLRETGVSVDVDFSARALDKKMKTAQREGYEMVTTPYGDLFIVKNLISKTSQTLDLKDLLALLKNFTVLNQ